MILIIVVILFAAIWGGFFFFRKDEGNSVRITVEGEEYGTYPLNQNKIIDIHGKNKVEIKNGKVSMLQADCPDQLCVNMLPIGESYEMIVCLPNQVIVEVFE